MIMKEERAGGGDLGAASGAKLVNGEVPPIRVMGRCLLNSSGGVARPAEVVRRVQLEIFGVNPVPLLALDGEADEHVEGEVDGAGGV